MVTQYLVERGAKVDMVTKVRAGGGYICYAILVMMMMMMMDVLYRVAPLPSWRQQRRVTCL